eukprot:7147614-Ditylum_brightwellii.AAC.1
MNFDEAMARKGKKEWEKEVDKEHGKFVKYSVWKPAPKSEVPKDAKVLTSTWVIKPKVNGTKRERLNACGFEQVDGLHYDSQDLLAPVVNDMTVRIVMTLIIMASWTAELLGVQGAFLNGRFQNGERLFMKVPQGFAKFYPADVL